MNEDALKELFSQYGGNPSKTKCLGGTDIPEITPRNLHYLVSLHAALEGQVKRQAIAIYYRDESLFATTTRSAFENTSLSSLIWTDCSRLDHARDGTLVAPAFSVTEPAFHVFDNFQTIPKENDRQLTFLHWVDGEGAGQLPNGSIMLLGLRIMDPLFVPVMSPAVKSRCKLVYLSGPNDLSFS